MNEIIIQPNDLYPLIEKKNTKIFDVRFNLLKKEIGYENYLKSHIKNAYYVNLESHLSSEETEHSGRHPLPHIEDFSAFLNKHGIDDQTYIIIYDDDNNAMSARLWWMLRLVGLTNCSVLDGGFKSWTSLKLPVTDSIPAMAENYNNKYSYNSKYLVATENIMQLTNEEDFLLIDAREKVRFLGKKEPIDKKAGHVPGAINMPFKNNLNQDGKFKNKEELLKMFLTTNKNSAEKVINMCGSGVTACHNHLAMEYCGFGKGKLYVGSWSAWSSYENNKIIRED